MKKGHAICIPYPAQGHISAMMKLAKLLRHKGFHITFVHTEHNYRRLLASSSNNPLKDLPDFQFRTIPDGLPMSEPDTSQDINALAFNIANNGLEPFRDLICQLNDSMDVPPVSCIVSDGIMSFTLDAAQEIGIPEILFWTISACSLLCLFHFPHLVERGLTPFKDASFLTNGDIDTVIEWIPGIERITMRDLPSQIRITDPNDPFYAFAMKEVSRTFKASAILLNTFDELEHKVLHSLSSMLNPTTPVYTVGPLQLFLNHIPVDKNITVMRSNLWKEESSIIDWLDSKPPGSVVYVNFGSVTVMTPQQLREFAWGLANSMHTFLWIIRPDLIKGESAVLPPSFLTRVADRGMLVSWCAQEQVLNHPSIGGFLTHSGWNSTVESLGCGVPLICWPFFADQQTNCFYSCTHWGIGMEIDNDVKRDEVEKLVKELMEGDKGKEMKRNVMEWKKKAEKATSACGGSSYSNLDKMIEEILQ